MNSLVRYDAMCRAIDAAYQVDEAKDIRDKAVAMEAYFRQAKNTEAERRACEIRLRAERKAGQLLAKMKKAQGKRTDLVARGDQVDDRQTLSDLSVSKDQSSRWQALANVPEEEFEAALGGEKKPTTNGIIAKPPQMPPTSLWLWGRLRDFERDGLLDMNSAEATELMTDAMLADVKRLAPIVAGWLEELSNDI
jgi:hypothetical protein